MDPEMVDLFSMDPVDVVAIWYMHAKRTGSLLSQQHWDTHARTYHNADPTLVTNAGCSGCRDMYTRIMDENSAPGKVVREWIAAQIPPIEQLTFDLEAC